MGLAEPRKRIKISHDPRNTKWSSTDSSHSFGKRLMQQQGWQQGQSLGARPPTSSASISDLDEKRLAAAKVGVIIKDDALGLGAQLKSRDVQHQKTGLDAFQGLLGRLNSKTEEEVRAVERKEGEKKLEVYAQGKWGGMVFVRGGVLVQGEEFKKKVDAERKAEEGKEKVEKVQKRENGLTDDAEKQRRMRKEEKSRLKEEKRQRKEDRRARKAVKHAETSLTDAGNGSKKDVLLMAASIPAPDEPISSESEGDASKTMIQQPRKRRRSSANAAEGSMRKPALALKNGRHVLRGRNIEAKRKAFSDTKGLDAIFMKT